MKRQEWEWIEGKQTEKWECVIRPQTHLFEFRQEGRITKKQEKS